MRMILVVLLCTASVARAQNLPVECRQTPIAPKDASWCEYMLQNKSLLEQFEAIQGSLKEMNKQLDAIVDALENPGEIPDPGPYEHIPSHPKQD